MKRSIAALITILFFASPTYSGPMVWQVVSGGDTVYIGGTVHMLRESDYPLPEEYDRAYLDSDILVLETDLGRLNDPAVIEMILSKGSFSEGESLEKILSDEAFAELRLYCDASGLPVAALNSLKPSLAATVLLGMELQKLGIDQDGIDLFYQKKAGSEGKTVKGLESIEDQVDYLLSMGEGYEDEFMIHTIEELKKTPEMIGVLIDSWKSGDEETIDSLLVESIRKEYPGLYETLIVERNRKWLPQIKDLFDSEEKELILVGSAHLIGEEGIIRRLEEMGCVVIRYGLE
ncbi:MAG: TraB/GumN family protein [Candidatus Krumholzibacteriota bacterium]|nr:TraB/GumN family protein [Candidatus Krumholzibacteriota bacterium]